MPTGLTGGLFDCMPTPAGPFGPSNLGLLAGGIEGGVCTGGLEDGPEGTLPIMP